MKTIGTTSLVTGQITVVDVAFLLISPASNKNGIILHRGTFFSLGTIAVFPCTVLASGTVTPLGVGTNVLSGAGNYSLGATQVTQSNTIDDVFIPAGNGLWLISNVTGAFHQAQLNYTQL